MRRLQCLPAEDEMGVVPDDGGTQAAHDIGEVDCETPFLLDNDSLEEAFMKQARRAMDETEWEN